MSVDEHPGDLLSAYLDDELAGDDVRAVEAHLVRCGRCSAELDDLADARRLLRALPAVPAPAGFTGGVIERRRRSTRRGASLALVAACVAVLAGLALAAPADDEQPSQADRLSLTGDASRFDATLDSGPAPGSSQTRQGDEPLMAQGGGTTATPPTTATSTTASTSDTEPDGSGSGSVGDRIDELATNLLELIGG